MDSPRRSPRIAEKYGATPRNHIALAEEQAHPYRDTLRQKRVHFDDVQRKNDTALCAATVFVGLVWTGFFAAVAFNEGLFRTSPFRWELSSIYP